MYFKDSRDIFIQATQIQEFKNLISQVEKKLRFPKDRDSITKDDLVYELVKSEFYREIISLISKKNNEYPEDYNKEKITEKELQKDINDFIINNINEIKVVKNDNNINYSLIKDSEENLLKDESEYPKYTVDEIFKEKQPAIKKRINHFYANKNDDLYEKYQKLFININNDLVSDIFNPNSYDGHKISSPRIFLSYAIKDALTAISLFFIFREHNIFLYVDFLFNQSTVNIKRTLANEMNKDGQFLFLDAPNAMITVDSKTYIRPWCFWEHGYFLGKAHNVQNESFRVGFAVPKGNSANSESMKEYKILNDILIGKII